MHRRNGTTPSYKDLQDEMKKQLMKIKTLSKMTDKAAECIVQLVDQMMKDFCPDILSGQKKVNVPAQ